MNEKLTQAAKEIAQHREEITEKLVQFAQTDMLLFWGHERDLILRQEEQWAPILRWAKDELDAQLKTTDGLEVPAENENANGKLKRFFDSLNNRELAAFYLAALNMRSVLLAAALVKKFITAEQAYQAAFLEELWQAENWGIDEEAEERRQLMKQELTAIENFLKDEKSAA